MKTVQLVYTCDLWHCTASKSLFGVYSTKNKALKAIKKNSPSISQNDINNLNAWNQTQGLEENYIIDSATLNP